MSTETKRTIAAPTGSDHAHVWKYRRRKYCRKAFRECGLCGRIERTQHIPAAGGGMRWTPWELLWESRPVFPITSNTKPIGGRHEQ